jgi:hypothetical protein
MGGYRDVEGYVIAIIHFGPDGTGSQRSWAVDDSQAGQVAGMLGVPHAEHMLTAEQMDRSNEVIGDLPTIWRSDL